MATTRLIKSIVFSRDRALRASPGWPSWMSIKSLQGAGGGGGGRSLHRRGLFVSWGGWGERKRERARHDGKGKERREAPAFSLFPFSRAHFLIFPIIAILIGIPSGSLCSLRSCPLPIIPLCLSWEEGLDFFLIG